MESLSLEQQLENMYVKLNISEDQQKSLNAYLELIKKRDQETWEHSLRVGLKGVEVAEYTKSIHPNALFYSGLLHDVGKILTNPNSLKKKEGFDERDKKELDKHSIDGYRLVRGIHDFSARILLRHHCFSESGYPKRIPPSEIEFSKSSERDIEYHARILSLIDFYDAATYRKDEKFGKERRQLSKEEVKELLLEHNKDQKCFIEKLYGAGIF